MTGEATHGDPYDFCYKFLGDLTTQDWCAIGQKLGVKSDESKSVKNKRELIQLVYRHNKQWFKDWDIENNKIYFYKFDRTFKGKKTLVINTSFEEPNNPENYEHKPAMTQNFLSKDQLLSIFDEEEISSDYQALDDLKISESVNSDHDTQSLLAQEDSAKPKSKSNVFHQKLRYDPDTEINRFLSCVESYAKANCITKEKQMIQITQTCLNQSDQGSLAVNIVSDADKQSWSKFKAKIISILGHSPDYYKSQFKTFKRNDMKLGLALSTLTQYFMRGWGISDRQLYPIEKEIILERFIESCNKPLSTMLKAEKTKLTLETVLSRASELEMCFAAETVNSIENPQSIPEIIDVLKQNHKDFMELQKEFREELSAMKQKLTNNTQKRKPNPEVFKKLSGLCSYYVKNVECPRSNCKYRHSGPISPEQLEVVKNFRK